MMCFCLCANGQGFTITGHVSDSESNESLIGVNIRQNDGNAYAITDYDGKCGITTEQCKKLVAKWYN